jgi:hypothetical protein
MKSKLVLYCAIAGLASLAASMGAPGVNAQGTPTTQAPVRHRVQITQVKPDMVQRWQELIRTEAIPAQKKAGIPWRHTFASGGPFGQGSTFVTVQPVTNYAQFDQPNAIQRALGPESAAKYNARIQPTIVATHARIDTYQANDSIESRAATAPPLIIVQTWQTLPGKLQEFLELWRSEYLPRYRKAGVRDVWVHTASFGAPLGQVTIVRPIGKYAELDQTPGLLQRGGLTPDAAAKVNARRATLATGSNQTVLRYVPELSYGTFGRATN